MEENLKKKKSNIKKILLGSIIGVLVGSLLGVTYAMFTFNSTSINNKLIAGDIYMRYKESSAINLNGAMPSATYPTEASGNYFEFQIIGKNTNTTKDITYNVKLAYGDNHETRTTRIGDQYLVFKLVEVLNGEEVAVTPEVNDKSFASIPGATLYTATIPANTTIESTRTFRVYARISENVVIGNINQTYTEQQWNNLYASVKINVDGGFENSTPIPTPSSNTVYVVTTEFMDIGSPIPAGVNQRTGVNGPSEAMADWQDIIGTPGETRPFYLKHILNGNDEIEESYVEFVITNELKTKLKTEYCNNDATCEAKYDNLVNGTYTLRGGVDESSLTTKTIYELNVNTIKTAFNYDTQPSICYDYSSAFYCALSGLNADALSDGRVSANDYPGYGCNVYEDGDSYCVFVN